ncbi:MAG TPA: plastocyanin/azurin family copper-binding protein [Candidatus Bathyarchaeia archaeon]|nr:plastocyanin/azurin family copper-binding protein [Candidatus Bathyarchaeia archaeon]
MTTQARKKSNTVWYIVAAIIIIIIIVAGVVAYLYTRPPSTSSSSPTVSVTLYAGSVNATAYGFGNTSSSITSPGPSLTFKVGDKVTVTLHVVGTMSHNWALVTQKVSGSTSLAFPNAQIASGSSPVLGGDTGSTTFTVTQAGTYYYICQVDSHVALGMWGNVTVTS